MMARPAPSRVNTVAEFFAAFPRCFDCHTYCVVGTDRFYLGNNVCGIHTVSLDLNLLPKVFQDELYSNLMQTMPE
jgi:hypothetical protein